MLDSKLPSLDFIIENAINEDKIFDDITTDLTVSSNVNSSFFINAREKLIFCGCDVVKRVFSRLMNSPKFSNCEVNLEFFKQDGDMVLASENIIAGTGNSKLILSAERTILNLIQHLSAIATQTNNYVLQLGNPSIKILDTRKTLPLYRELQKYAVKCGGGYNHRFNLADLILIKDNHINACQNIDNVFNKIDNVGALKIEIECDNFSQVQQSLKHNPDIIMLDNMNFDELQKSINLIQAHHQKILIEVSGGINLDNIHLYRNFKIDYISIGSITNSIKNVDIGLDFCN